MKVSNNILWLAIFLISCNNQIDFSDPKEVVKNYRELRNESKIKESFDYLADTSKTIVTLQEYIDFYSVSDSVDKNYNYEIRAIKLMPIDPLYPNYRLVELEYLRPSENGKDTTKGYWYYTTVDQKQQWKIVWLANVIKSGEKLFYAQAFEDAIKSYKESLKYNPLEGYIYNRIGWCYFRLSNYDEAKEYTKKAIELNPNRDENYNLLASIYSSQDMKELAIENYKKAIMLCFSDNKGKALLYANLSNVYLELNKISLAKENINKALEIAPNDTFAWWKKGNILLEEFNEEETLKCFEKAISLEPMEGYLQSILYYDYAVELFKSNIAVKKDFIFEESNNKSFKSKADIHKDLEKAKKYTLMALDLNPDDSDYKRLLFEINKRISN